MTTITEISAEEMLAEVRLTRIGAEKALKALKALKANIYAKTHAQLLAEIGELKEQEESLEASLNQLVAEIGELKEQERALEASLNPFGLNIQKQIDNYIEATVNCCICILALALFAYLLSGYMSINVSNLISPVMKLL